jgi:hypothetical protein
MHEGQGENGALADLRQHGGRSTDVADGVIRSEGVKRLPAEQAKL